MDWLKSNLPEIIALVLGLLLALGVIELPEGVSLEQLIEALVAIILLVLANLGKNAIRRARS